MKIANSGKADAVLCAAKRYTRWGWRVVPVPAEKKTPILERWPKLRLTESDLRDYFESEENVGILLGEPSGGVVDVDLDCDEAVFLARMFLPDTERIHGHESRPASHWWYKATPIGIHDDRAVFLT